MTLYQDHPFVTVEIHAAGIEAGWLTYVTDPELSRKTQLYVARQAVVAWRRPGPRNVHVFTTGEDFNLHGAQAAVDAAVGLLARVARAA